MSILLCSFAVHADEGMWILKELNRESSERMKELGFQFPIDSLYSEKNPSLKDAVVIFGGGCTGVAVSDEGLIFTNHHCGYDAIQQHSSVEHDYLKDGFVSQTKKDELYTPGLKIAFLKKTQDVTDLVTAGITPATTEKERYEIIDSLSNIILNDYKELITDTTLLPKGVLKAYKDKDFVRAQIIPFYERNKYYLVVYDVFEDVRMVLAPPSSIGKFGGDADNWMWPRHTGDFSVFRVYAGKNNKPAKHSEDNVPYKPKYTIPVSLKGYGKGDYAMTVGYPGSTDRYLSSWGVKELIESRNKPRIEVRGIKQEIWKNAMNADDAVRIKYASKFSRSSNYWKNSIGMNSALRRLNVIESKEETERQLNAWLNNNPEQKAVYGEALSLLDSAYSYSSDYIRTAIYFNEVFARGFELTTFPNILLRASGATAKEKDEKVKEVLDETYKNYEVALDKQVMPVLLKLYAERVPAEFRPDIYKTIDKKFKGDYNKYTDWLFSKSKFTTLDGALSLYGKSNEKKFEKDPAVQFLRSVNKVNKMLADTLSKSNDQESKGTRLFFAALQAMNPDKAYSSNANFTQRMSYGSINGYEPMDAATYDYYSTVKGIFEKENENDPEFFVQQYILDKLRAKNWDKYADKDGELIVNFISNNDITGGNSGSPVFNNNVELIGLAFDGNWEALSGDIVFENEMQRTISVDIRFVLYVIDTIMECPRLIDELNLRK